ncbi:putative deoxyuridine 5'-triphosphate nucleotidohydrolase [Besnoitia besnoiti]|uniref:Deoxyuridine 5'-triphosphate nucleotidohydrolase n=1 Tax=Besnoitia besnoiti TaxID=94643 RepID=A0A2A9MQ09_BESBE|nr:putative deoxyuridine 5'-triphosphate nucleotidohydrolase [Besnoitia besnoiti]PFH38516.1 putative deoxyuridine 5'-triphosphate nucleotidohydrolase [Besnoitia besnoiti]
MLLRVQALTPEVRAMYAAHGHYHAGDSGLDLFVLEDQEIKAGETSFVKLGIKAAAYTKDGEAGEKNVSWLLMPRSSISKTPLRLANSVGLIDAGYRGEVMAAVDNIKTFPYTLKKGDRIVQAVAFNGEGITLELVDELDKTARGEGGFGSTTEPEPKKAKNDETNGN